MFGFTEKEQRRYERSLLLIKVAVIVLLFLFIIVCVIGFDALNSPRAAVAPTSVMQQVHQLLAPFLPKS